MSIRIQLLALATTLVTATVFAQASEPHPEETAAVQLAQQAESAIATKQFSDAIKAYKSAIKLVPDDIDLQYKLATTLLAADRLPEMWQVLRLAARKAPNHPDVSRALLAYWKMFAEQGLFNTNETIDKVVSVLGKPDSVAKGPDRNRYVYGFLAIEVKHGEKNLHQTIDLRGVTAEMINPKEIVQLDLDGRGRKVDHRIINKNTTLAEYVLPGERVQKWSELFSIQRLHGLAKRGGTPKQVAAGILKSLIKMHPDCKFRFLEESDERAMYEWKIPGDDKTPAQHEIVLLMKGQIDMHRVAFVVKRPEMASEQYSQWVGILKSAKLTPIDTARKISAKPPSLVNQEVTETQAWNLGRFLSVAVFAHARKQKETARKHLALAFRQARELNIDMPAPFKLGDDPVENVSQAVDYLVVQVPPRLREQMPDSRVATYEMAARTFTLAMLCSDEDLVQKSMLMIRRASDRSELPDALIAALEERTNEGATPDQIRGIISKLHADVAVYLASDSQSQTQSETKSVSPALNRKSATESQVLPNDGGSVGEIISQ